MYYAGISLLLFTCLFFAFMSVVFYSYQFRLNIMDALNRFGILPKLLISFPLAIFIGYFSYFMVESFANSQNSASTSEIFYCSIYMAVIAIYFTICAAMFHAKVFQKIKKFVLFSKKICVVFGLFSIFISCIYGYQLYFFISLAIVKKHME